jgi:hypothetical protein
VPGGKEAAIALRNCDPGLPVKRNMPQSLLDHDVDGDVWNSSVGDGSTQVRNRHANITPWDARGDDTYGETCRDWAGQSSVATTVAR